MILDSEEQKQELLSLLVLVPIQGNLFQGIDKILDRIKLLIATIEKAKIEDKSNG
jgi:hypothetical protein